MSVRNNEAILDLSLEAAVPIRMMIAARLDPDTRAARLADPGIVDAITAHGDDLLYGGKDCAPSFNRLAEALALMAFQPGGVTFHGRHYCAHHQACLDGQGKEE